MEGESGGGGGGPGRADANAVASGTIPRLGTEAVIYLTGWCKKNTSGLRWFLLMI